MNKAQHRRNNLMTDNLMTDNLNPSLKKAQELYYKRKEDIQVIKSNPISLEICADIEEFLKVFKDYEEESPVPYGGFLKRIQYRLQGGEREWWIGPLKE